MQIDWWTLGLQAINALVLIWLLNRFLFRPVAGILTERQAETRRIVAEAEAAKAAAEKERDSAQKTASELAASRSEALKDAAEDAEKQKALLLAAARGEADRLRAEAKKEIAFAREEEASAAGDRASKLAIEIAGRLLDRLPDEARISGFIEGIAEGVASLPLEARNGLATDGHSLQLTAARELTEDERKACQEALGRALSRKVEIDVVVDPALVAGLELRGAHAEIRNSFRADLDRLEAELTGHGQEKA